MTRDPPALVIRSRYGALRDLVPIYSLYQLGLNLAVGAAIAWLARPFERLPPLLILAVMVGWVLQYLSRPSRMEVTNDEAASLGTLLDRQEELSRSDVDGRWRRTGRSAWRQWPHQFVAMIPGPDRVTIVAPREWLTALLMDLETRRGMGDHLPCDDRGVLSEPTPDQPLPWHAHVPAALIGAACLGMAIWQVSGAGTLGVGISAAAIAQHRFATILTHMFAHGSVMHFAMNMCVLFAIGGTLTVRLGARPLSWLRFVTVFVLSALAGAALYLALHPAGTVPMLGASGGIFGLMGLLLRTTPDGGEIVPIRSARVRRVIWELVKQNAFLFALLGLMAWASGSAGGLAWEAHLGGFLFGLIVGPRLLPRADAADATPVRPVIG